MKKVITFPWFFLAFSMLLLQCVPSGKEETAPPNILFAIADDASFPHMGAYGCTWVKTPAFDRVSAQGLLFNNAYTPNAKCAPSRACIITGRNSWQLEEAANHVPFFPVKFKSYAEVLAQNGYHVGYTAKGWAPGVANNPDGTPRQLTGKAYNSFTTTPPAAYISPNDYAANFEDFLRQKPAGQPFCFWYGSTEPHRAYKYGAGLEKGKKSIDEIGTVPAFWPDNDTVRTDMLDYAFEIEYFDQHLMRMLDILDKAGELENTIVVVTSDNGMPFPRVKGNSYEYSNHMPLAIMWKKGIKNPGRKIDDLVSFIDFAPTWFDVAGIDPLAVGMPPMQGMSLTDIFSSENSGVVTGYRDHLLLGQERHDVGRPDDVGYPIRGIVKDGFLLIKNYEPDRWPACNPETGYLNADGSPTKTVLINGRFDEIIHENWQQSFGRRPQEELYNLQDDPECLNNLAGLVEYSERKSAMLSQMETELTAQNDPRMLGNGHIFDEYLYSGEDVRDFYNRYMAGEKLNAGWVNETDFDARPEKALE
ncbi:MAG: sulfatase [Cyclobacteriaceae bacterium]|nr:sulfatase [Cyclobacteriaceae bacterium]